MGSKNLKAIAVRGSRDLPCHDLAALMRESEQAYGYMAEHKFFKMWQREGLMNVMAYANSMGILPTRNFSDGNYSGIDRINGETMLGGYKIGDSACFACSMTCGNICLVKQGKYVGTVTEGPEYESCAMLGSNVGVDDFAAVLKANQLCDELGIDSAEAIAKLKAKGIEAKPDSGLRELGTKAGLTPIQVAEIIRN